MVAAKHVGIEIDITRPDDGAELAVDGDGLEDVAVVADCAEHAAGLQQIGDVDLVQGAVAEGTPILTPSVDGEMLWDVCRIGRCGRVTMREGLG